LIWQLPTVLYVNDFLLTSAPHASCFEVEAVETNAATDEPRNVRRLH
jgi:hypothetical protein